jgi:hypothetical protein
MPEVVMRPFVLSLVLSVTVLFPTVGRAQVDRFRSPSPEATAATAEWQINGDAMPMAGLMYYPTHEMRPFDGQVMQQIGIYQGVPVYTDTTLEPWSVAYVPVARDRMRMYERKRDGELAGTTGSRAPAFVVVKPSAPGATETETSVGTAGTVVPSPARESGAVASPERPRRTRVESIPRPRSNVGVWLEFDGTRWYSDGAPASFSPERFTRIGEYRGFPVYRDVTGGTDDIYVPLAKDGPLARYARR